MPTAAMQTEQLTREQITALVAAHCLTPTATVLPTYNQQQIERTLLAVGDIAPSRMARLSRELRRDISSQHSARHLVSELQRVQNALSYWNNAFQQLATTQARSFQRDLVEDIIALQQEFDDVYVLPARPGTSLPALAVTTREPVRLHGEQNGTMDLGRFQLAYPLAAVGQDSSTSSAFRVRALTPVYSLLQNECSFVHPNVQRRPREPDGHPSLWSGVCLGDGAAAITAAIRRGDVLDAFVMVQTMLQTHSDSPYLHLDDWWMTTTHCLHLAGINDIFRCRCNRLVCRHCISACTQCGLPVCFCCYIDVDRRPDSSAFPPASDKSPLCCRLCGARPEELAELAVPYAPLLATAGISSSGVARVLGTRVQAEAVLLTEPGVLNLPREELFELQLRAGGVIVPETAGPMSGSGIYAGTAAAGTTSGIEAYEPEDDGPGSGHLPF